jgi:hypothetical protein
MRNPAFSRVMSRGSESIRNSISARRSGDAGRPMRPFEYDLLTQKVIAPMRRPTACQPERDEIETCISPGGVPGRPDE